MNTSTAPAVASAKAKPNLRWRVVDIVVASVIGVASGLIFLAWNVAHEPLSGLVGFLPGLQALFGGGWLFAGVLTALVVRKPGAAIYGEMIAATVSALVGNQWGALTLVSGFVQGLGAELIFALFVYTNWRLSGAILAGMGAGLAMAITDLTLWYPGAAPLFATVYTISAIISGAILAGVLSWLAVRGLASAGALNRFASGRVPTRR
ncbi:hypothetical protein FVA74_05380 [Salinibacterium sp. dk2585]|uniref:ECF transporter S component n=1 Tax=unclassified Salinibacterium TaxID=2632331 RepID=UPI0011C24E78|nr:MULTISPECIES: ECF transporter S component [unclassified Salinibacterium]QEE61071.1 hypothetical protein FVA74_05380 [Salinibacterium sp. dk2585]TXK53013.1 hypothetical protein FVP63_11500 [Salinibacterium sp. dk5596]